MKKLAVDALLCLTLLCPLAATSQEARKTTVADFEQMLTTLSKNDARRAEQIAAFVLTERLNRSRLENLESRYPGKKTHDALVALADASEMHGLPAAEMPPNPAPSMDEQRRIVKLAADYLLKTLPTLPNFLANRQTVFYEEAKPETFSINARDSVQFQPATHALQVVRRSTTRVAYRDGQEVLDTSSHRNADLRPGVATPSHPPQLMASNGEFGAILKIVLFDAPHGEITWYHWERGPNGLEAHFRYSVPAEHSHFRVDFPCGSAGSTHFPAYNGEFAVDPATGSIVRLLLFAALQKPCEPAQISIITEFGPVQLDGKTYICPQHSVSMSWLPRPSADGHSIYARRLNDTSFTHYRLFGSEVRILPGPIDPVPEPKP